MAKWLEPCNGHRRDGEQCKAPTVPGAFVCRRHGGSAPQVQRAARERLLEERVFEALSVWEESRDFEELCRIAAAERDLRGYRQELAEIRELERVKRRARAAERPPAELPPRGPDGRFIRFIEPQHGPGEPTSALQPAVSDAEVPPAELGALLFGGPRVIIEGA
jgi:hypothetical protein